MVQSDRHTLQQLKGKELLGLALFLGVSTLALRGFSPLPPLSEQGRAMLGPGPSQEMLGIALIVYSFSAIIMILSRIMSGELKSAPFSNASYLAVFYVFFHLSDLLDGNFWAVFAAGSTIFALESYQIWSWVPEEEDSR